MGEITFWYTVRGLRGSGQGRAGMNYARWAIFPAKTVGLRDAMRRPLTAQQPDLWRLKRALDTAVEYLPSQSLANTIYV